MELAIPADEGGVQAAHVGRDEAGIHRQGGAHLRYRPAEPDIVHPELGVGPGGRACEPIDTGRDLLHRGEIGRIDPRIGQLHQIGPITDHVRVGVSPPHSAAPEGGAPLSQRFSSVGAQTPPGLEIDDELRVPRSTSSGGPVQIEVPVVAPQLDESLILAGLPFRAPPSHPHSERPVAQHVLGAGGKSKVGLGPIAELQPPADQAEGLLVDLGAQRGCGRRPAGLPLRKHRAATRIPGRSRSRSR